MRSLRRLLLGGGRLAIAFAMLTGAPAGAQSSRGDLLVIGGPIRSGNDWVEAMAVRDGAIVGVGTAQDMRKLAGREARVLDVHGMTVLPGLVDSHVHPLFAGLAEASCQLTPGASARAIAKAVAGCAARQRPGDWIRGGNWVAAAFAPGEQTRTLLDAAAPHNPVLLNDEALHSVWVNSEALRRAGIDRDTLDPVGGIIERDARGEPTGLLRENATRLVEHAVPPDSLAARRAAIRWAADRMLSYGITSFTVASVRDADMQPFAELSHEGAVRQRIRGCIVWDANQPTQREMGERLIANRAASRTERFNPDCVKLFLDGVPTESHTGAMLAPYADRASGDVRPPQGLLLIPQAELDVAVARFDKMGLSIKFHAAGDAAVRAAIDAVAHARAVNGRDGPVHAVGHSTLVDPADISRVAGLNAAWEFSPYIWYPTPIASVDIMKAVGPERMARWMPVAEALRTGALVVAGSDWPVIPSVNPWLGIETLVTRAAPGGGAETLGGGEAIDRREALKLFTENGARLMGLGDRIGILRPGMRADFIITEQNPYRIPATSIHEVRVAKAYIDGELVFSRNK